MRLLLMVGMLMMVGCATTQSPEQLAGKTLLSMKEVIVTSAVEVDKLCDQKLIPAEKCLAAKGYYEASKPAYDAAADSLMTAILMKNAPDAWSRFAIANQKFVDLYTDALKLSIELGVVKKEVTQ